jgi:acyl dehydratase
MSQALEIKRPLTGGKFLRAALLSLRKRSGETSILDETPLTRRGVSLDPARINSYAKICGFTDRQGVPLTYPHNLAFPLHMMAMLRPSFPFPVVGLVHLENSIRQHARLDSGDRLDIEVKLGRWLAHPKGQVVAIKTRMTREGALVWDSTSLYLRLGVATPRGELYHGIPGDETPLVTTNRWPVSADLGRRFARISGDANPIHTSVLGARAFGFPRPIAHGMWTKARALSELLPQARIAQASVRVAFKTAVFLPGGVTLLVGPPSTPLTFELRDRREIKPHLRGELEW